jgi:hypothetical protein
MNPTAVNRCHGGNAAISAGPKLRRVRKTSADHWRAAVDLRDDVRVSLSQAVLEFLAEEGVAVTRSAGPKSAAE